MTFITLTHATQNEPVDLNTAQIFYLQHSKSLKATLVVSASGAYCPVAESREQIQQILTEKTQSKSP